MVPPLDSSRVSRLKKRFLDVLAGSVRLDARGASLFLEGLCAQEDPTVCLDAINNSAHGLSSVRSAMQFDLSDKFMNGLGSTVLEYLLRASDVGGNTLDNVLFHIVEPPIFWSVFVRTFQQNALSEDAQLVFARMLARLLTLQDRDTGPYQDIASQPSNQESLLSSSRQEIREVGHLIKHLLSGATGSSVTARNALHGPGGRHDNDFADFRDIAILPTADEVMCRKPPFLRAAFHDELGASEAPVKDYLDNTFRMLREDMIFDVRQDVEAALQKSSKHRGLRVNGITLVGIYTGSVGRKTCWGIQLQCSTDFWQLKDLKGGEARINFLTKDPRGSKILRHQSLVCLTSGQAIIGFGSVNRVEELLARKPPVVVLQLDGEANIRKIVTSLCTGQNFQLIQISTAVFAFEPVLSALKTKDCPLPLENEIVLWDREAQLASSPNRLALSHISNTLISNPSAALDGLLDLPKRICLDESQAKSLIAGLQQRVSLIQGPPGTGKSFIGALLAKVIHDKTPKTIVVVCYTNHALDQFLCDLLDYAIPAESIVRLGGRANESTDHLALHKQPRVRYAYNWGEIDGLKTTASGYENKLRTHFDALLDADNSNLIKYLGQNHQEFFDAFHVPLETEDGMTRVGQGGQDIDEAYLFSRWVRGLDAGVLSDEPHVRASTRIWTMARPARQELLAKWRDELIVEELKPIYHDGVAYNKLQDSIKQEFASPTVAILRQKRIVACTTTGAAIHAKSLEQASPDILLVEEAGEILESHILTALSHKVDQMILIGDHKQLRPKVNNYQLTVERGEGFDLNRSLFERLVLKGYPHETLSMQHRMRPSISGFVRELTYPELKDAPSTYGRPDIRGVQSNVVFVDHTHPEDENTLVGDRADGGTKTSKQNMYEVQMVLKIVRYLAQQGYKSDDIVVLTPYLGQLHQLQNALKHDNDPVLNDMDASDLARADLSFAPSAAKAKKTRIHLATIDNYQGEESKIVIASLTRSNDTYSIGFMNSPERLNVLLSRARDGFVLIGNSQTFLKSRTGGALWKQLLSLMEKGGYVYQGFPVKCERHPEQIKLLKHGNDFDKHCPNGGCTTPCGFKLACGHACEMKCHPQRTSALHDPHDTSQCKQSVSGKCEAGHHTNTWKCGRDRPARCAACVKEAKRLEEIAQRELEAQKKRDEAEIEHRRQMAELEAERVAAEELLKRQREAAAEKARQHLAELREGERRREQEQQELEAKKRCNEAEVERRRRMAELEVKRVAAEELRERQRQASARLEELREKERRREQELRELEAQKKRDEAEVEHRRSMARLEAERAAAEELHKRRHQAVLEKIRYQRHLAEVQEEERRRRQEQAAAERWRIGLFADPQPRGESGLGAAATKEPASSSCTIQ